MRSPLIGRLLVVLAFAGGLGCDPATNAPGDESPRTVVHLSQNVTAATTWTKDNLYVVDTSIQIGAVLTIEPDTIVKLAPEVSLLIEPNGAIVADATAAAPCLFTSLKDDANGGDTNGDGAESAPARGDWSYVKVGASGSVFHQCRFMYGGGNMPYNGTVKVVGDSSVTITDCTFAHNQGGTFEDPRAAALHLAGAAAPTVLTGNTFFDNDLPIVVNGTFDLDDSNLFAAEVEGAPVGNRYDAILWGGNYETVGDRVWSATKVPIVIGGEPLAVAEDTTLTLGDGVTIKLGDGQRIEAFGRLIAEATSRITFTSLRDDTVAGDTNGDGAETTAAPGDWGWIAVGADGSRFTRCLFTYGGSAKPYHATFELSDTCSVTLIENTFANNTGGTLADQRAAAVNLGASTVGTVLTGNVFHDNDLPMVINGNVSVDDSNLFHARLEGEATPRRNLHEGIFVDGVQHMVREHATWSNTDVAFVVPHDTVLTVEEGGTLTLGDDVVVKFDGGRLDLLGALEQGTGTAFTSIVDDARLGDANGDDAASTPVKGDWVGVNLCLGGPCEWATWENIWFAANP